MTGTRSCSSCVFAVPQIGDDAAPRFDCHRYPPLVLTDVASADYVRMWPQVDGEDWCGEWRKSTST